MFSNTLSSWYGSVDGYNSKFMSVDKFLGIGAPMKEIEREEFRKPVSASAGSNRNYYHELYKQALKCIESTPPTASVSPRSSYGSPSSVSPCQPASALSPSLVSYDQMPTPPINTSPHPAGMYPTFPKVPLESHCADVMCNRPKGGCGWPMPDHNYEECKTHDIIAQRNLVMHQKGKT